MTSGNKAEQLKVFISYSRREATAADALVEGLLASGFEVTIDRRDLPFGEKWQTELAEFIRLSDTVVWLISDASIQSKWVNWELDEVARWNKRLVPVMIAETARDALPRQLGEIHILPTEGAFDPQHDLDELVRVLETDRVWLKEAGRLQDRAQEWINKRRTSALLLSRGALSDAERWKDLRPTKAPAPAQEILDLLLASRQALTRRHRWWIGASSAVAVGAMGLTTIAWWQSSEAERQRNVAVKQERLAIEQTRMALENQSQFLADLSRQRLEAGDGTAAIEIALAALPDDSRSEPRPLIKVAQAALYRAIEEHREIYVSPIVAVKPPWIFHKLSPDQRKLVVLQHAQDGLRPEVWNLGTLKRMGNFPAHLGDVEVYFIAGSETLLTLQRKRSTDEENPNSKPHDWPDAPQDGLLRAFDLTSGAETFRLDGVTHFDIAKNAARFLTLQRGGKGTLWEGLDPLRAMSLAVDQTTTDLRFEVDDRVASAVGGSSAQARYFELASGQEIGTDDVDRLKKTAAPEAGRARIVLSDDRTRRVVGFQYKNSLRARLFEVGKKAPIAVLETGIAAGPFGAAFSRDSSRLVTTAPAHTAKIWDARSGALLVTLMGHGGPVTSVAFSHDGNRVLSTSNDGTIRLWNAATGAQLTTFSRHFDKIQAAFLSEDGTLILSIAERSLRLWRVEPFTEGPVKFDPELSVTEVAVAQNRRQLMLVDGNDVVHVLTPGAVPTKIPLRDSRSVTGNVCLKAPTELESGNEKRDLWFSNDGALVVLGYRDGSDEEGYTAPRCAWRAENGAPAPIPPQRLSYDRGDDGDDAYPTDFEQDQLHQESLTITFNDAGRPQIYDLALRRVIAEINNLSLPIRKVRTHLRQLFAILDGGRRLQVIDATSGRKLFSIFEPGRDVEDFGFANKGAALFVQTVKTGDAPQPEHRLALYETRNGSLQVDDAIEPYTPLILVGTGAITRPSLSTEKNQDEDDFGHVFIDARTGEKKPLLNWGADAVISDIDRDKGLVFRTTGYRNNLDGFSRILDPALASERTAIETGIISDGRIYQSGRRAWTRAGKDSWGRLLEIPVTLWDLERGAPIVEIMGETGVAALEPKDTVLQIRHYTGHFERRDGDFGFVLFRTNPASLPVARAFQLHREGMTVLLVGGRGGHNASRDVEASKEEESSRHFSVSQAMWLPMAVNDLPRIREGKEVLPRCLTAAERSENFLASVPPRWCITGPGLERETDAGKWRPKWPYQTAEWRNWLIARDRGETPPLPKGE